VSSLGGFLVVDGTMGITGVVLFASCSLLVITSGAVVAADCIRVSSAGNVDNLLFSLPVVVAGLVVVVVVVVVVVEVDDVDDVDGVVVVVVVGGDVVVVVVIVVLLRLVVVVESDDDEDDGLEVVVAVVVVVDEDDGDDDGGGNNVDNVVDRFTAALVDSDVTTVVMLSDGSTSVFFA